MDDYERTSLDMKVVESVLTRLAVQVGCCYVSDLRFEPYSTNALALLPAFPCSEAERAYVGQYIAYNAPATRG